MTEEIQTNTLTTRVHKAFTLAEVLIALAVIGIIAVLTIPSFIQKHEEKMTIVRLKKAYSLLTQATNMAILEHGAPDTWGLSPKQPIYDEEGNITGYDVSGIAIQRDYITKYLKGDNCEYLYECTSLPKTYIAYNLSKTTADTVDGSLVKFQYFRTVDGTVIQFTNVVSSTCTYQGRRCSDIEVFIPTKKGLYRRGVNNFMFNLTKNGIELSGTSSSTRFSFAIDCSMKSKSEANGHGCTAWVIMNENMDYLRCDDLSCDGKHSCSD